METPQKTLKDEVKLFLKVTLYIIIFALLARVIYLEIYAQINYHAQYNLCEKNTLLNKTVSKANLASYIERNTNETGNQGEFIRTRVKACVEKNGCYTLCGKIGTEKAHPTLSSILSPLEEDTSGICEPLCYYRIAI